MNKAFVDDFLFCADAFSLLEKTYQFHRGATSLAKDLHEHLRRLIVALKGDIDDETFVMLGAEADKFALIVRQMNAADRQLVLSNIPERLIARIDRLSHELHAEHGVRRSAEKIAQLEDVAFSLAGAFGVAPPEELAFELEGEKVGTMDWTLFKEELARVGSVLATS